MRTPPCARRAAARAAAPGTARESGAAAAAPSRRGPVGARGAQGAQGLEPDVPGAHGDGVRVHLLDEAAVHVELLLLRGEPQASPEQVLRPEEPDALGPVELRGRRLLGELDVGLEAHLDPVEGARGEAPRAPQPLLFEPVGVLRRPEGRERRARGVDTTSPRVPSTATRLPGGIWRVAS